MRFDREPLGILNNDKKASYFSTPCSNLVFDKKGLLILSYSVNSFSWDFSFSEYCSIPLVWEGGEFKFD